MKKRKRGSVKVKCYICGHEWWYNGIYKTFKKTEKFNNFYISCSKCRTPLKISKLKEMMKKGDNNGS